MSLLGRLEDLSVPDIVQIVFLSRRTGILEIIDSRGRHTVIFNHGLIVNASSPDAPDLGSYLLRAGRLTADTLEVLRQREEAGIPLGVAALEAKMLAAADLATVLTERITEVVVPLVTSRDGEFNFILSDALSPLDIEYDPRAVFPQGGIAPQRIFGGDGEKLKPLRGLEESMKAGKALLRGTASPVSSAPAELDLGIGHAPAAPAAPPVEGPKAQAPEEAPFDLMEEEARSGSLEDLLALEPQGAPEPEPAEAPAPLSPPPAAAPAEKEAAVGRFRIDAAETALEAGERNVVLFERSPLLRVAAKREFTRRNLQIAQYGSIEDCRKVITELLRRNVFFITFLELARDDGGIASEAEQLLATVKKKNHLLPVVVIDREADMKRRARLLALGADHYLTKPSEAHLQPALADEQLALFADELVNFAERSFDEYSETIGGAGGKTLYELAHDERVERSFGVLRQLINEVSNPNDFGQLVETILRLAGEYLDRAVILIGKERSFIGMGAMGATGDHSSIDERAKALRISYAEPSVLSDVAVSGQAHRGKIRRTAANAELIAHLGTILPTEVVVLPILHKGNVIGLLYGDNAEQKQPIGDLSGLEVFLSQAGFAFENAVIAASRRE